MSADAEIKAGFFDSGVGGLSILRAVKALCPDNPVEYLADTANAPYGNRPPEGVVRLSEANARELISRGCEVIVVACNTATAAAIDHLRKWRPDVPFVGVEPAVKPAALRSKTGVVGVLATAGTLHGRLFNETKARFAKDVTVVAAVADEFVEEAEKLAGASPDEALPSERERIHSVVKAKIEPLLNAGADVIVLGCTHFPLLMPVIAEVCGERAEVIDPSEAVARRVKNVIEDVKRRKRK
ncbi:MAG: glutamate racemase [Kiritimatiellae bacterium]|nr:glutamate racemase [Kiritimatiellia bacterium]